MRPLKQQGAPSSSLHSLEKQFVEVQMTPFRGHVRNINRD